MYCLSKQRQIIVSLWSKIPYIVYHAAIQFRISTFSCKYIWIRVFRVNLLYSIWYAVWYAVSFWRHLKRRRYISTASYWTLTHIMFLFLHIHAALFCQYTSLLKFPITCNCVNFLCRRWHLRSESLRRAGVWAHAWATPLSFLKKINPCHLVCCSNYLQNLIDRLIHFLSSSTGIQSLYSCSFPRKFQSPGTWGDLPLVDSLSLSLFKWDSLASSTPLRAVQPWWWEVKSGGEARGRANLPSGLFCDYASHGFIAVF